jgi:hypothetical protein
MTLDAANFGSRPDIQTQVFLTVSAHTHNASPPEREPRILLWEWHDQHRRVAMLESIGSIDSRVGA